MLVTDFLDKNARIYPNKVAVVFEGRRYTYPELAQRVNRLANSLVRLGLNKGDRISILDSNSLEFVEIYYGALKCGAIVAPVNWRLSSREICQIINEVGSKFLFVGKDFIKIVKDIQPELTTVSHYVCIGDSPENMKKYEEIISTPSEIKPVIEVDDDEDVALILHTGGTTGGPKGVMITHRGLYEGCVTVCLGARVTPADVYLCIAPLFHMACSFVFSHHFIGATVVIARAFTSAEDVLKLMQDEGVSWLFMPPIMIYWLMEHPELIQKCDLSRFRHIVFSAAPVAPENIKKAAALLNCGAILIGGMTESSGVASASVIDDVQNTSLEILASAGKETVLSWLEVVDENGRKVPRNQVGELIVKGSMVMKCYWKRPEATSETIKDGWLYTGDLVRIDEEGNLYYVDRKKDMIKSGGESVYSKEVEEVISTHPAVLDVAVIGVPDKVWGEAVKAIIELKPGMTATQEEIIEHCKANLARYKAPKSVDFVEKGTLPRGGLGKVQKNILRKRYR